LTSSFVAVPQSFYLHFPLFVQMDELRTCPRIGSCPQPQISEAFASKTACCYYSNTPSDYGN
jgi:hypothetical protein